MKIAQRGTPNRLQLQTTDRQPLARGEVEIRVKAAGLNFIDVLNVLGLYPGEPPLGIECAGEIVAKGAGVMGLEIGDAVMAIAPGSFSQYVTVDANLAIAMPANCTVEEAATIPESFLTAYWSLHHLAQIAPGDRVLIHAAAGGVGQAAVQLALQAGAEVYATASPSKWHALEALGVKAVMNSRTLDFAEEIRARTDSRGVDIILNSLTGEGFIAKSVSVLAQNGRFLELAKRDIWSPEQMAQFDRMSPISRSTPPEPVGNKPPKFSRYCAIWCSNWKTTNSNPCRKPSFPSSQPFVRFAPCNRPNISARSCWRSPQPHRRSCVPTAAI